MQVDENFENLTEIVTVVTSKLVNELTLEIDRTTQTLTPFIKFYCLFIHSQIIHK